MTTTQLSHTRTRPIALFALTAAILFLSLGGFIGGLSFITDPSGAGIGMSTDALKPLPILSNFTLPGLFLLAAYAIAPLVFLYGLWKGARWAWWATVIDSVVLIGWIAGEILILRLLAGITLITALDGVLILIIALLPSIRRYYAPANS
jgi:hypothetical protein